MTVSLHKDYAPKTPYSERWVQGGVKTHLPQVGDKRVEFQTFDRDGNVLERNVGEGHYFRHGRHWTTRVVDYAILPNTTTIVDDLSGWERWVRPTESLHDAIDSFNEFLTNAAALLDRAA